VVFADIGCVWGVCVCEGVHVCVCVGNYKDTLGVCCSLSKPVQRRLKALKRLQRDAFEIEVKFYEELHQLEHKYENLYSSLYDKVRATDYFLLPHQTKTVLRPFLRTTWVSRCQKRTFGLYGARED